MQLSISSNGECLLAPRRRSNILRSYLNLEAGILTTPKNDVCIVVSWDSFDKMIYMPDFYCIGLASFLDNLVG